MDVWLDSGVAWHTLNLSSEESADVVLEGVDQFRGWFQSLLLTSVAARVICLTSTSFSFFIFYFFKNCCFIIFKIISHLLFD